MPPILQDLFAATVISRIVGAIIILLVGWIIAKVISGIVHAVFHRLRLNARMAGGPPAESTGPDLEGLLAGIVYWLILLFAIVGAFDLLQLTLITTPLTAFLGLVLLFIPRVFAAIILLVIGLIVAQLVRRIVTQLLVATGIDRLGTRAGMAADGAPRLSNLLGMLVFAIIFVPVLTSALDALGLGSVSVPLSNMLNRFLEAIPNILAAIILLAVTYIGGRIVAEIVAGILSGLGFNQLPVRLGLSSASTVSTTSPSQTVGGIILVALMVTASIEAAQLLGFTLVADLLSRLLVFGARLLMGLIIVAVGLYVARFAYSAIVNSGGSQAVLQAVIARTAIMVLAVAMALRETDLANDIVTLAFGLLLGAIAVAIALAFGIGGREFAREELSTWRRTSLFGSRSTPRHPDFTPPTTPGVNNERIVRDTDSG